LYFAILSGHPTRPTVVVDHASFMPATKDYFFVASGLVTPAGSTCTVAVKVKAEGGPSVVVGGLTAGPAAFITLPDR
jgi:hypothetical protein